ncbi:hypothetical protein BX667DRAFT_271312 [Coemansia mojavensis]|nr:hypothetical protein BX667DRAFT_271312 [Coemansia mojavensis]
MTFQLHYGWVMQFLALVATAAYMFGRLAVWHWIITVFPIYVCRIVKWLVVCEQFSDCSMAGHNLIWVLQDIARIPVVVTGIGVLNQPQPISPRFTGIEQLLYTPTPRMFLASRISYDMEHQLLFILEQLPVNMYSCNLMWFVQQCLSTPESETLFSGLIRYIGDRRRR